MALEAWVEARREWLAARRKENIEGVLRAQAIALPLPPSFNDAVRVPRAERGVFVGLMRRDPTTGRTFDFDIAALVPLAERLGASGFAVYPDDLHLGSYSDILAVAQATALPVLSRDVVVDPVQIVMARTHGAAAITLDPAVVSEVELKGLFRQALDLGLEVLFEGRSAGDLERIARVRVSGADSTGARVLGVHAVALDGRSADLSAYEKAAQSAPEYVASVATAAIADETDALALTAMGYDALIVAAPLLAAHDFTAAMQTFAGDAA